MIDDIFQDLPNHELYGYGALCVGDTCEVDLITHNISPVKIQGFVHAYARYANKKFKTKVFNDVLYIKRVK